MRPRVFINYRRDDSKGEALALRQFLAAQLPRFEIFMDVDGGLRGAENYVRVLDEQVAGSQLIVSVIGARWLTVADAQGRRRLDDERDYVRLEIASAVRREIPILPVLIDEARMPAEGELPPEIRLISNKQAMPLRHTRFEADARDIAQRIRDITKFDKGRLLGRLRAAAVVLLAFAAGAGAAWAALQYVRRQPVEIGLVRFYDKSNDFLLNGPAHTLPAAIKGSRRQIWFVGTTFYISTDTHKQLLMDKLKSGVEIHFIVLDPDSGAIRPAAFNLNKSESELKGQCISGIETFADILRQLRKDDAAAAGRLEVRLARDEFLSRSYFFDPGSPSGQTYIVPQVNGMNSQQLPGLLLDNGSAPHAASYFKGVANTWSSGRLEPLENWLERHPEIK